MYPVHMFLFDVNIPYKYTIPTDKVKSMSMAVGSSSLYHLSVITSVSSKRSAFINL